MHLYKFYVTIIIVGGLMNSNNYYSIAVSNCLSEFESLFTKNKFISKNIY